MYSKDNYHNVVFWSLSECFSPNFDQRLSFFRKKENISQTCFAKMLRIKNVQTYNRYEKKGAQPSIALLANMAYALNITVNLLTGGYLPNALGRALDYLKRVGIDWRTGDGCFYLAHPVGIEMCYDEDGYMEKYETRDVAFGENELLYYTSRAYDKTIMNIGSELDGIFYMTFRPLFYTQIASGTPARAVTRTDIPYCLFQQALYADPDKIFLTVYAGDPISPDEPSAGE